VKKNKTTRKLNLKIDILRTLQMNELRHVDGGSFETWHCQNERTAASSGPVCCA
jgi:hypothetical protein